MHDSVQGGGVHQRTHSTGYTDLRLQTRPSTPKPCSTAKGGTGRGLGPSPLADLTPVEGRKRGAWPGTQHAMSSCITCLSKGGATLVNIVLLRTAC